MPNFQIAAKHLANLYNVGFGGKESGRFRISSKQVKELLGRKRLYPDEIEKLTRAALEEGFVLIDMDSFYVLLGANTFVNYRRLSGEALATAVGDPTVA